MDNKRILVVDDDPDLLFLVSHGIKSLGPDYQVNTAESAVAALKQAQKHKFDLVITDFVMPDMTGLELISQIRTFSPETRFILMTAHHDTKRIRHEVKDLNLGGFVGKPFALSELLSVVEQVAVGTGESFDPSFPTSSVREAITDELQNLQRHTGAEIVVLVNINGTPVHQAGADEPAKIARLAAFVSANFLAISELASLFGDNESVFRTSYYEGDHYNIFASNINGDYFLAVLFSANSKPGTVWFYTKQTATTLASLLPAIDSIDQTNSNVANDFNTLLGNNNNEV